MIDPSRKMVLCHPGISHMQLSKLNFGMSLTGKQKRDFYYIFNVILSFLNSNSVCLMIIYLEQINRWLLFVFKLTGSTIYQAIFISNPEVRRYFLGAMSIFKTETGCTIYRAIYISNHEVSCSFLEAIFISNNEVSLTYSKGILNKTEQICCIIRKGIINKNQESGRTYFKGIINKNKESGRTYFKGIINKN